MSFPNKETQFKPGQSGNPKGAAKGSKHINSYVQDLLNDPKFYATLQLNGRKKSHRGAPMRAIIKAQAIRALEGDTRAFDALVKAGWSQKIEQENTGEQTITVITRNSGSHNKTPVPINIVPDEDDADD